MRLTKITLLFANLFLVFAFCSDVQALPGALDPTFDSDGKTTTIVNNASIGEDMAIQTDGKIVVIGYAWFSTSDYDIALVRYNADGSLDSGFGIGGKVSLPESGTQLARCLAIQPDGKLLVSVQVGTDSDSNLAVYRFNSDGSLDMTFGTVGKAIQNIVRSVGVDIVLQSDGKIVLAGGVSNVFTVFRLNAGGTLDTSFNSVGYNTIPNTFAATAVVLQNDGKIIVGGKDFNNQKGVWGRFNTDGTLEGGSLIRSDVEIDDAAIQTDGKIVFSGTWKASLMDIAITRYNSDKTLDKNFGSLGVSKVFFRAPNQAFSRAGSVVIQPSGRIVVGGTLFPGSGSSVFALARFNSHGLLDVGFGDGGKVETVVGNSSQTSGLANQINSIAMQSDGKIVAAGLIREPTVVSIAIARYDGSDSNTLANRAPFDFDGDGRTDISVIRPSTNVWYNLLSFTSSDSQRAFGTSGDLYAPADYDGDGRTDYAIYRPSTGWWWYQLSAIAGTHTYNFGVTGGIPRPADYDGDGIIDFTLYVPSTNVWHRRTSSDGSFTAIQFGIAGDKPLYGDFDGDGKSDLAVFRPSTGDWWYLSSINNAQLAVHWGISTDVPVPADYDGDRKTDFAVYRPSEGVWYIINSSNGSFTIMNFGLAADKPVPADYDGDGRADLAVYRDGVWWIWQSSNNSSIALQWGTANDIPMPAY